MNAFTAYLGGFLTYAPTLVVHVLLARAAIRRWPRFRGLFLLIAAVPFGMELTRWPLTAGRIQLPAWFIFGMALWLYTAFFGYLCFHAVRFTATRLFARRDADVGRRQLIRSVAYASLLAPASVSLYGTFIERTDFGVEEVTLPVPNLPDDLEGLRILQISDVHRSVFLSREELERVVDAARGLSPHLIMHTGDFISSKGDPLEECIEQLSRLRCTLGAFGCLGNHELYAQVEAQATALAGQRGIRVLRQEAQLLRIGTAQLNLVGVDYQRSVDREHYLAGVEHMVVPGAVNLLLSHNPDVFPTAARMGFAVTLAGHTHGGQVRTEILGADINPARFYTPFVKGLYRQDGKLCYVTRGIGSIGIPSRVGSPPEITLIRLSRA